MVLHRFKVDMMLMSRQRKKEVVPELLAEIRQHETALCKTKANVHILEESHIAEVAALTKQICGLKLRHIQEQRNLRATHRLYGDRPIKYWSKLHREKAPRDLIPASEKENERGHAGVKIVWV